MSGAVERYVIRANHEWAFIYVDEQAGVFTSYSSFGTYAYCWSHRGECTLKEFLRGLDFSYFMEKTRPEYRRFDPEKTVKGIKAAILERRREGFMDASDARDAWNEAEELWHNNQHEFFDALRSSNPLMEFYSGDYSDIASESPDGDSRGFWREIWPEFLKQMVASSPEMSPAHRGDAAQ